MKTVEEEITNLMESILVEFVNTTFGSMEMREERYSLWKIFLKDKKGNVLSKFKWRDFRGREFNQEHFTVECDYDLLDRLEDPKMGNKQEVKENVREQFFNFFFDHGNDSIFKESVDKIDLLSSYIDVEVSTNFGDEGNPDFLYYFQKPYFFKDRHENLSKDNKKWIKALKLVKKQTNGIADIEKELKTDFQITLAAVQDDISGSALEFVHDSLKKDKEIVSRFLFVSGCENTNRSDITLSF